MAGRTGRFCHHRIALLNGDASDLLSGNGRDVARLRDLLEDTELGRAHREQALAAQGEGYAGLERANQDGARVKQRVRVIAEVANTGIKAGMIGLVVAVQTPAGRGASFTDLAATACLVRFTKPLFNAWADSLPAPPAHLLVGAELWLREGEVEPVGED